MADTQYEIKIRLLSDTTFGRGDGVAGLVDEEVEHDSTTGLPFISGKTLKGLLVEECANFMFSAEQVVDDEVWKQLHKSAQFLFGRPGSTHADDAQMEIGDATLPSNLIQAVEYEVANENLTTQQVLESWTTIRRQTSIAHQGAPEDGSLRAMRVVLRETEFIAPIVFKTNQVDENVTFETALALLNICVRMLRRGGTGRNRGRGRLSAELLVDGKKLDDSLLKGWMGVN